MIFAIRIPAITTTAPPISQGAKNKNISDAISRGLTETRSRKNLIGKKNLTQENFDKFSMEMQIPDDMPPIYVQASKDDDVVDYRNSVVLDKALTDKNINHKFLLFETGGHGYGMKDCEFSRQSKWQESLLQWLKDINIVK
jgi:acetyl esterase/lipase